MASYADKVTTYYFSVLNIDKGYVDRGRQIIGHFKNRFAEKNFFFFFFLCKQTYYLQVTLFIGE